jgi:hypothetical protein
MIFYVDNVKEISLARYLRWLMIAMFWKVTSGRVINFCKSPVDSLLLKMKAGNYLAVDTA